MNQRLLILSAFFGLFHAFPLSAQVGFALPFVNQAAPGQVLHLPVTVSNFDSILSAQFVIRWDPAVLEFINVHSFNLPDLGSEDFGLTNTLDSGLLRFGWYSTDTFGVTQPNGAAIFKIRFEVVGPVLSGTSVLLGEAPPLTFFEVIQRGGTVYGFFDSTNVEPILDQGFVAVGYTVAAGEPAGRAPFHLDIFPNPFFERTQAIFDLEQAAVLHVSLTDALGRSLMEKTLDLPPGRSGMEIDRAQLREAGPCFLVVRAGGFSRAYPLFLR